MRWEGIGRWGLGDGVWGEKAAVGREDGIRSEAKKAEGKWKMGRKQGGRGKDG